MIAFLSGSVAGCAHWSEHRVVNADKPLVTVDIARFEVGADQVKIVGGGRGLHERNGARADSVILRVGERFEARGFNCVERWTLLTIEDEHAIFKVRGSGTADVGIYPFLPSARWDGIVVVCGRAGGHPSAGPAKE